MSNGGEVDRRWREMLVRRGGRDEQMKEREER